MGLPRHRGSAGGDRLDDVLVAGAAADVALELVADGRLVENVAEPANHVDGRDDHAGRAEAALKTVVLVEGLLHRVELVAGSEALDGGDAGAGDLDGERGARLHRDAIDQHQAGAALRSVAADVGAGQPELLAQHLDKEGAILNLGGRRLAVDGDFYDGQTGSSFSPNAI